MSLLEPLPMTFSLFDLKRRTVVIGDREEKGASRHRFGGGGYSGLQRTASHPAVHVLFRIDSHDPLVPFEIEGVRWLPLLCAIRYGAGELIYSITADDEVEIIDQDPTDPWNDYPYPSYPDALPEESVVLEERGYDPADPLDAWYLAAIFGYDDLSPKQYESLKEFVTQKGLYDEEQIETVEDYLEYNEMPYVQGSPPPECRNPTCPRHGDQILLPLAIFQEADDRCSQLWGEYTGSLQITYQVCEHCRAIHVSNQCG